VVGSLRRRQAGLNEPRKVNPLSDGGLEILWDDAHRSRYAGRDLRLACRCALCEDEWSGERRLQEAAVPAQITVGRVSPVGRYGLQLDFSDGHKTGIFTFPRLRALCSCEACRPSGTE
jgi:ATP-binding protein involved in chromosome partitioning